MRRHGPRRRTRAFACRAGEASLGLAVLTLLLPVVAHAAVGECSQDTKRWVAIRLSGPGFGPELAGAVLTDLRTEVVRHGIEACPAGTPGLPAPIATMAIEARQPTAIHLSLDITDPATGQPSERELQLDSMPLDGHSLAVAVAADELLTSSWIKLASRRTVEPPVIAPPPVVPAAVAVPAAPAAAPARHELGILVVTERFGDAGWARGLDLSLRRWLLPRWGAELSAGARSIVIQPAPHGSVRSRAIPLSLGVLASLWPFPARARAGAAAALTLMPLFLSGVPEADATARSQTALALYLRGGVWADIALGRFRLRVAGGAGAPLRSVAADDTGVAVGGLRGVELHVHAGLAVEL